MFIQENSMVDIIIYYKKVGLHYQSFGEEEFNEVELTEDEKSNFKKIVIKMKQLTWGLYNDLQESAIEIDSEGNRKFNYQKYKEVRLLKLISSWNATAIDSKGEDSPVKVSERAIKSLAPEIAETILNAYDQVMYLSESEEKK